MKAVICSALLAVNAAAPSLTLCRHWTVSVDHLESEPGRVVFTLIGLAASPKLPILVLSYSHESWNALLTCGEPLEGSMANLSTAWDGQNERIIWRMTRDHGAAFAPDATSFVSRLIACRKLEVEFCVAGQPRRAAFDVTGLEKEIDNFPQAKRALAPNKTKRKVPLPKTLTALSVSEVSK